MIAEQRRQTEERERAAERQRKFVQYSAVKVGANVQLSIKDMSMGVASVRGSVASNENRHITLLNGITYNYEDIIDLMVLEGVNESAIMRNKLIGIWTGSTKHSYSAKVFLFGGDSWSRQCDYTWVFGSDNNVSQHCVRRETVCDNNHSIKIGKVTLSTRGTWTVLNNGSAIEIKLQAGLNAGKTVRYDLIKHLDGRIEFRADLDTLKMEKPVANAKNERNWYDKDGSRHYEADSKPATTTTHVTITETPVILSKKQ